MENYDIDTATAEEIMTPYVIMLSDSATFEDVVKSLYDNNISAVFIHKKTTDEFFIISQSDIIHFMRVEGLNLPSIKDIPVSKLMKGPIRMVDIDTPVDKIIHVMAKHEYKRVLISDKNTPVGVVSTRDVLIWNNTYFKPAKPQVLLFMDNQTSNFISQYIFEENVDSSLQRDLIDIYGGALNSISLMTDEILKKSGKMAQLTKDNRCILFEPDKVITGVLICDFNSIDLRCKLQEATRKFCEVYAKELESSQHMHGICRTCDVSPVLPIFVGE
ncbi:hypothetical protein NEF87_003456 [Candidatus Lokiarchaeum ossiferum]|uniref:CBS domain-containing protein n=1 Tax=Candidatus Lokiarchaeum ossiferum TaxID=2951803 RepID=A0ABY6HUG7_9ARCH|nr:hypothetical protein NEF87_003456 [Candidatus Lokiarchaeum sp. B-35]